jgi:hypothetical protein
MILQRRRSVLVRMTESGDRLETVRIVNNPERLAAVMARAGEAPEVVLEGHVRVVLGCGRARRGRRAGAFGAPAGGEGVLVSAGEERRDAADLADLLRMGRLPQAWIAPPASRELRELVRHRAKLVHLRSGLRCQVHAVLAGQGVAVPVSDLFGVGGGKLLTRATVSPMARRRIDSLLRLINVNVFDVEIDAAAKTTAGQLAGHAGYTAVQALPGIGPILGAHSWSRSATCTASAVQRSWPAGSA